MLSDLRQSGSIEQDADTVSFLYRNEYYLGDEPPEQKQGETQSRYDERRLAWEAQRERSRGVAEFIVAKNREGASNQTVKLTWQASRMRFRDADDYQSDRETI
jgi:replicative DNA helicase